MFVHVCVRACMSASLPVFVAQCGVWLLGVIMMIILFAEGRRDVEPMTGKQLHEMRHLLRKSE